MTHNSRPITRPDGKTMQVLRLLTILTLAISLPVLGQGGPRGGDVQVSVETAVVEHRELVSSVRAIGTLLAEASATLRAEVPGQILAVHFQEGQPLKEGAKLYSIEATVLEAEVNEARANVSRSESALNRAQELREKQFGGRKYFVVTPVTPLITCSVYLISSSISAGV